MLSQTPQCEWKVLVSTSSCKNAKNDQIYSKSWHDAHENTFVCCLWATNSRLIGLTNQAFLEIWAMFMYAPNQSSRFISLVLLMSRHKKEGGYLFKNWYFFLVFITNRCFSFNLFIVFLLQILGIYVLQEMKILRFGTVWISNIAAFILLFHLYAWCSMFWGIFLHIRWNIWFSTFQM